MTFISDSTPQQPAFLYATYDPSAAISASSTLAGTAAANLLQPDEARGWSPAGTGAATITIDLGIATLCSDVALAGSAMGPTVAGVSWSGDGVTYTELITYFTLTDLIANWIQFAPVTCQYLRISFQWQPARFRLNHVCTGNLVRLPFFADNFCVAPIQAEGTSLISYSGRYLGSVTQKVMRPFSLSFDQITPAEETAFSSWVSACIASAQGFFLVPDTSTNACFFGSVDRNWKYEPKMRTGLYTIPDIPFTARAL